MYLGTSAFGRGTVYSGPVFTPAAQAAGSSGVAAGQAQTISQRAFGISQSPQAGPNTAHYGTVGSMLLGVGLLLFIWWSLPRLRRVGTVNFWWGVAVGVLGTWVLHAIMPGARAVGQSG